MKIYVALSTIMLIGLVTGEKIDLPVPCRNTSDCTSTIGLPKEAYCNDGYCMCPNNEGIKNCSSVAANMHENKVSGPLVFRTCKHEQDCKFQGGFCNTTINQCDCLKDFVPSSNKQHCVPKVRSIESSCTDVNQCLAFLANTTCYNNKCVCATGYHYVDKACWRIAGYGQRCTKNQECSHIEGVTCTSNMTCECMAETVLNANSERCLPVAREIMENCTESVQCSTTFQYSSCINKICQCREGYHYEHEMTRCFVDKAIDAECANDYECYQTEDTQNSSSTKSLRCLSNRCVCAEAYLRENDRCVSAGASFIASLSIIVPLLALICNPFSW